MPIVMRVEQLRDIDIPAKIYYSLSKDVQIAVRTFIDLGGKGWETALLMQDKLWETQRGRSIGHLRWALELAKIDESTLLVWTRKPNINEKVICQIKSPSLMKRLLSWNK